MADCGYSLLLDVYHASVLIVRSVWRAKFPTRHTTAVSPAVVVVPASDIPAWERMAATLRVEPRPQSVGDVRCADSRASLNELSDNALADWIAGISTAGPDR